MLYLLYGADTYRSRRKLREIIEEYRAKAGSSLNLHRVDAEDHDAAELKALAGNSSLFSAKKLIVVERGLSNAGYAETLSSVIKEKKNKGDAVFVLWEEEIAEEAQKRFAEIKSLCDKAQEFRRLDGLALNRWIRREAAGRNLNLVSSDAMYLSSFGSDLWALSGELDKMALGAAIGVGTGAYDEHLIFRLGDAFFTSHKDALKAMMLLRERGEDPLKILSYLTGHARILLAVKSAVGERRPVPSELGVHPYVVKKASLQAETLSFERLSSALCGFFEEDWKIKTGLSRPSESLARMLLCRPI